VRRERVWRVWTECGRRDRVWRVWRESVESGSVGRVERFLTTFTRVWEGSVETVRTERECGERIYVERECVCESPKEVWRE